MKTVIVLMGLLLTNITFAQDRAYPTNSSQNVSSERMDQLIDFAIENGKSFEVPGGHLISISSTRALGEMEPHKSEYFTLFGIYTNQGYFKPFYARVISETWNVTGEGNWEVDQWSFKSSLKGNLVNVRRNYILEKPSGAVLDYYSVPVKAPQSPSMQERWQRKLNLVMDIFLGR